MSQPNVSLVDRLSLVGENVARVGNWITPVSEALGGVTAAEAFWKPASDERSIAEIVAHMTAWTAWCSRFLDGADTEVTDWPPVVVSDEAAAWGAARQELLTALEDLQTAITTLDPAELFLAPTPDITSTDRFTGLASILVHNAYHAGQITKLREAYKRISFSV